ncbi:protein MANNAN SYNTHESIS-RELATED 1-like [Lycium ferocissimum]|uniref:protein MANNAN SYNTHESIS-RELATED 1-like n=1 Tax=Lycium ferocissimum TaxID=112874 RepID=UPI002815D46B|nr:protein MANNAN SYNTHESIS-RELATED 1-like [Lycium ferocissimum]
MARDVRQVVAGLLTGSMLIMLCNMVKRDHFDPIYVENLSVQYDLIKVSKQSLVKLSDTNGGLWRDNLSLKPCWRKPLSTNEAQAKGYIFFTLTDNPEDHVTQIADAVVVAKYLGATLVLPEIRGTKRGNKRQFGDIYDIERFNTSLNGTVQIVKDPPLEASNVNITNIKVPFMVTKDFIASKIQPIFNSKGNLMLSTDLSSSTMAKAKEIIKKDNVKRTPSMDPNACLAIFGSLELQQELNQLVSTMVGTLRSLSYKTNGQFVAVDLKVESLASMCRGNVMKSKHCFDAKEIGEFLKKIGFQRHATIYLTQSGWHSSLDDFRKMFPNSFTKDAIIPAYERAKYQITKDSEFEKVVDFQICTQADVFVPTISNMFYTNVVAKRIASGKTEVLDPTQKGSSSFATAVDYVSPYISKKLHWAYSCFC